MAETTADAAYEHALRTGQPDALYWFLPQHMQVRVEQARTTEVEEIVRAAAEKHGSPGVTAMYGRPPGRGWCDCDGASEVFEQLATTNFASPEAQQLVAEIRGRMRRHVRPAREDPPPCRSYRPCSSRTPISSS